MESEEAYRLAFENTSDGIFTIDLDFKVSSITPSVESQLGYRVEEVLGKPMQDLNILTPESLDRAVFDVMQILSGAKIKRAVYEFIAKDGTKKIGEVSGTPIFREGKILGAAAVVRDITERKMVEEALRKEYAFRNAIIDNIADGLCVCNKITEHPFTKFTVWNERMTRITGYTMDEINRLGWYQTVCPDAEPQARAIERMKRKLQGKDFFSENEKIIRADGEKRDLNISTSVLESDDGMVHVLALMQDITERKYADEERLNLQERLKRSEKMEALGQLAGGVAHDLNNVLGAISGYSQLLLMEISEGQKIKGYAEKILESTEKSAAIIQDLLTLARRGVTATDMINLNKVVSDFLSTPVFEKIKDHHPHVIFRTECAENLLNVKGSSIHLEKTVMNLVSNAAEAISKKGEVTIRTENRYLEKSRRSYGEVKEGDYVVLTVSDTGMGIPAENIDNIFEPFYTKKTMGRSGTGLGLAIVWGTVKDYNGHIDVQSKVDEGTTFTLYFPGTREGLARKQHKELIESYTGNGESVLVVDDIPEQRDITTRLLVKLEYKVHAVSSGEEAVEYLRKKEADILVLDMIMSPGIDGLETYQRVLEINPRQKAIIVSGFSSNARVREAQKLGVGAHVKKPFILERIGVAIRDELSR